MNHSAQITEPDNTAVRTSLWRALHVLADAQPHILDDTIGLQLIAPPAGWQERPDMKFTKRLRASIVARARFIEDLITEKHAKGMNQYVILGAGLDTFAQRRKDITAGLQIYEIDQAATLNWKQQRLAELNMDMPANLHYVPVNFETSSWYEELLKAGFDAAKPAVIACTGVTLYLTKEAIVSALEQIGKFASGSVLAMTFYLPIHLLDEEDRIMQEMGEKGARAAGTPFVSFFTPEEIIQLAVDAGFKNNTTISTKDMQNRYFADRTDGLQPAGGEVFLVSEIG
ncbi:MAG: class I SAM-dependent methyltransferase [Cytophaga sp.]|uniref:class I SAM-dependent methyltransferase n=1 Tax=Cytophaga sp. TaxID=29535 RepID=UPI003F7EFEB0